MYLLRWTFIFVIVLKKFVTGSSIAEEINFEVSNMRESAKNDPQVHMTEEMMESQLDQTNADETDEFDASPSELVETRIPIEESPEAEDPATQVKRPRRRRRRRRRKRPKPAANAEGVEPYYTLPEEEVKRKPLKYRPENVDELIPESSNNPPRRRNVKRRRRPVKRPIMDDYLTTAEANSESSNNTDEPLPEHQNHEQLVEEKPKKYEYQSDFSSVKVMKDEIEYQKSPTGSVHNAAKGNDVGYESVLKESFETRPSKGSEQSKISESGHRAKENEFVTRHKDDESSKGHPTFEHSKSSDSGHRARENEFVTRHEPSKVHPALDARRAESLHPPMDTRKSEVHNESKVHEEQNANPRLRKRPLQKENTKVESEPEAEASDLKNHVKNTRKDDPKTKDENTNKIVHHKTKSDDRLKNNETKKEVFKLRRLPPISAIFRQAKMRPKNESFLKPPFKVETSKIRENVGNEILTHVAVNEVQRLAQNETDEERPEESSIAVNDTRKSQQPLVTEDDGSGPNNDGDSFEFPIITYTEQRQKHTSTSVAEPKHTTAAPPKQKSSTQASEVHVELKSTSSTSSSSTENTAFIYVPCNQTITELLRASSNVTIGNVPTSTSKNVVQDRSNTGLLDHGSVRPLNKTLRNETANVLDAAALNELEKLLQSEMETMDSRSTEKGANDSLVNAVSLPEGDASSLGSELEYLFQNKAATSTFAKDTPDTKFWSEHNLRQPKRLQESSKHKAATTVKENGGDSLGYGKENIVLSYTSTSGSGLFNEIDPQELLRENELSLHLRNNSSYRRLTPDSIVHKSKNHNERKKLPLAVKSAIIISGAILALAVLGFFALLLSCKIRHAKSRMKCHRELYREQFQNSEFRQSSRSTSPVVSKSNYNGRNFANNIQSNVASNRNYYLWQTLRKTFQYD